MSDRTLALRLAVQNGARAQAELDKLGEGAAKVGERVADASRKAAAGAAQAQAAMGQTGAAATRAAAAVAGSNRAMVDGASSVVDALGSIRNMWMSIGALAGLGISAAQVIQAADAVTVLRNRLALATGSAAAAARAYEDLFAVAQRARVSFTELGATYATMARAGQALGLTHEKLLTVTAAVGNAMAISGGSAQSMQAALVQLGQGMAAGVLRGEELNSVMEQAPRLAQALADGLGVPIGQLRRLGEEGELTSQRVMEALTKAAPQLAREVEGATKTVGQAYTGLGNATTYLVGTVDQATGASASLASMLSTLAGGLKSLADLIKQNETAFGIVASALAGATVIVALGVLKATLVALLPVFGAVALALGPIGAAVAGIAAGIGAAAAAFSAFRNSETGLRNRIQSLEYGDTLRLRGQERLDEIARLKAELAKVQAANATPTPVADLRRVEAGIEAAEAAAREAQLTRLAEIKNKLGGVDREYIKTLQDLAALRNAGTLDEAEYLRLVQQAVAGTSAAKDAAGKLAQARREAAEAARQQAAEEQAATARTLQDQMRDEEGLRKAVAATREQAQAQRVANEATLDGSDAVAQLEIARLADNAALAERQALHAMERLQNGALAELYREQATALRDLAKERAGALSAASTVKAREASKRANDALAADWERTVGGIEQSLSDALMRGFEGGRGFLDSFVSTVKSAFQTMVLKPVVSAVVRPIAGAVGSALGLPAMAGQVGGAGGALGQLGGLAQMGGSFLGSLFGSAGAYGAAIGTTSIGVGSQAAMLAAQTAEFGAAGLAATSSAAAGAGAGMSSMLAAAGPYAAAAAALYAIYDTFKHRATLHKGSLVGISATGAASTLYGRDPHRILDNLLPETDAALRALGGGTVGSLNALSGAFGGRGGFAAELAYSADGKDASIGSYTVTRDGRVVSRVGPAGDFAKYSSDAAQGYEAYVRDVAGATREAVDAIGLPEWAREQFAKLGDSATIEQFDALATSIVQFQQGLKSMQGAVAQLGGVFGRVAGLGGDALKQLVDFAGGLDAFSTQAMAYVQGYFGRDEIAAIKAREVRDVLAGVGITQDLSTRDQFRALVEGADVGSEAGRRQLATLLGVSGSFGEIADYLGETGGTLGSAASAAPELGVLGPLFASGTSQQVAATNGVREAVDSMHGTLERWLDRIGRAPVSGGGLDRTTLPTEVDLP